MTRTTKRTRRITFAAAAASAILILSGALFAAAQSADDALAKGFQNPPDAAKPRVWWHWMNGNVTKEGIKADFEWMKRAGIAGFQNFDAGLATPQIVAKRLVYMTPEWKDAFQYAATLADQLHLEMAIAGSPGWSESGGPWVTPAQAMKKYVWSELRLDGGRRFSGLLPKPPSTTGHYQNEGGRHEGYEEGSKAAPPEFYADSAVIAYRAPESDRTMAELGAKVTASGGTFDLAALTDGDLAEATLLPAAPAGEKAWVGFEFPRAQKIRGVTIISENSPRRGRGTVIRELEASDDGQRFRTVAAIPDGVRTVAFLPVTARVFRVTASVKAPADGGQAPTGIRIAGSFRATPSRPR